MLGEGTMKGRWCESVGWGSARGPNLSAPSQTYLQVPSFTGPSHSLSRHAAECGPLREE